MRFLSRLIRKKQTSRRIIRKKETRVTNTRSRFRGVQLNPNHDGCCEAVRESVGQRFLSNEVPMLPLAACDSDDCRCTYELFDDRRTAVRRVGDFIHEAQRQFRLINRRNSGTGGVRGRRRSD